MTGSTRVTVPREPLDDPDRVAADRDVDGVGADRDPVPDGLAAEQRVDRRQLVPDRAGEPDREAVGRDAQRAGAGAVARVLAARAAVVDRHELVAPGGRDPCALLRDHDVGGKRADLDLVDADGGRGRRVVAEEQHGGGWRDEQHAEQRAERDAALEPVRQARRDGVSWGAGHQRSTSWVPDSRVAASGTLSWASAGRKPGCRAATKRWRAAEQR